MRPMQALFFAGPMLLAKGTNAAGYVVDLDGQTDFHMDDKYSCRVGQSGHGDQCSPGATREGRQCCAARSCDAVQSSCAVSVPPNNDALFRRVHHCVRTVCTGAKRIRG
jgi:hypothetical protein